MFLSGHEWETTYSYDNVTYFRCIKCNSRKKEKYV